MKHSRICLILCCCILSLFLLFSGCDSTPPQETMPATSTLSVTVKDVIPAAFVGTSYDLQSIITAEEGVTYSFTASYTDPESGETKTLTVRKNKITPKAEADISVTVTATKGTDTATANFTVPISISADIIDKLLVTEGIAGEADSNVKKVITKDSTYLQNQLSSSAIQVEFQNPDAMDTGASLMLLSHYSLQPYYSAQVWRNAAVTFWVYNPTEQAVTFKLSSYNPETGKTLLWNSAENVQVQTAIPGQWTQLYFSLYDMGITQPLFNSPDQIREDFLKIQARFDGSGTCKIYMDAIDIVHADTIAELTTGYTSPALPRGDFSDLLKNHHVYTLDSIASLSPSSHGNGSSDAYRFGADQQAGFPVLYIDFPETTDISGFNYLKFDVFAENCHPYVSAAIRYIGEDGTVHRSGSSYNFKQDEWRTLYLNLHSLKDADLTQAVGISFTIHLDSKFIANAFNCIYFDNVSLYEYPEDEPQMAPAIIEDNDILNAPLYVSNPKPNTMGVCKVSTDETGLQKSNSTLLFWANSVCGYPTVTFYYENEQDWSNYNVLSFETHQVNAHYWMHFEILYLDENGNQHTLSMYHDTIFNHWLPTNAPLEWFATADNQSAKPEHLSRVVGFRISVDFSNNFTDEVAMIFFDNFTLS